MNRWGARRATDPCFYNCFFHKREFFLVFQILGNKTLDLSHFHFSFGLSKTNTTGCISTPAGCDTLPPGASCSVNCEPPYIGTGNPEGAKEHIQVISVRWETEETANSNVQEKENMDECHIQSHPSGDLLFLLQNWTTHVLLIVLSKKNRGGSTTATCPDRILGLIPVAVSCLFPEFLWSSFAWCVSEF